MANSEGVAAFDQFDAQGGPANAQLAHFSGARGADAE
jgi:hypothetical protein